MPFLCTTKRVIVISIIAVVCAILTVATILILSHWPTLARQQLIDNLVFRNGTIGFEQFKSTAELKNLRISISVFNVTNANEVIKTSSKLRVKEIGPFVYHEYKYKEILKNKQDNGLITYKLKRRFTFQPELSVGDPKTLNITWINVPVIAATSFIDKLPALARFPVRVGFNNFIFTYKEPAFITDSVEKFIFSGSYRKLFAELEKIPAITNFVKKWPLPDNKFAILYQKNDTWLPGRDYNFTTAAGFGPNQTPRDLNQYKLMNGSSSLPFWKPFGDCNQLRGTDGEFFSPFTDSSRKLEVYSMDICRKLSLKYRRAVIIEGVPVNEYTLDRRDLQSPKKNPNNSCYCLAQDPNQCPLDGLIDLSTCVTEGVVASMAHFLYGSPELTSRINDLKEPNETDDEPIIHIEPNTGLSVQVRVPVQFNVKLKKSPDYRIFDFFKDTSPLIIPLLTVTEAAELDQDQATLLRRKLMLMDPWFIAMIFGGLIILVGVVVVVGAIAYNHNVSSRRGATETDPLLPRVYSRNNRRQRHK